MSGIVWPPRWACRFGSQAYGGQVVLLLDVVSWHSIFDSDRCWHHDAWLLFEARVLTWNGRISDEIWISTIYDSNLGLKILKLVRQLCLLFCVRCVLCWNQTISVSFETCHNLARRSIRTIRVSWFLRNNLKGHQIKRHLRPTVGSNTRLVNSLKRQGRWTWWHRGLGENCSGWWYKVCAWNLLLVYRSFLATWWCYNVVCLGMQAIASL